jgi:hypothetical protein
VRLLETIALAVNIDRKHVFRDFVVDRGNYK